MTVLPSGPKVTAAVRVEISARLVVITILISQIVSSLILTLNESWLYSQTETHFADLLPQVIWSLRNFLHALILTIILRVVFILKKLRSSYENFATSAYAKMTRLHCRSQHIRVNRVIRVFSSCICCCHPCFYINLQAVCELTSSNNFRDKQGVLKLMVGVRGPGPMYHLPGNVMRLLALSILTRSPNMSFLARLVSDNSGSLEKLE